MEFKNIEYKQFHPEKNEEFNEAEIEQTVKGMIESLVGSQKNKIGEGMTAEVHFSESNSKMCYKILNKEHHNFVPVVNNIEVEAKLMESAREVAGNVKIPDPWLLIHADYEDDKRIEGESDVLMMTRLNAVTLAEILKGEVEFPKYFDNGKNIRIFFKSLREFVHRLHGIGIWHRDLHEGNIMVDLDDGSPCVIDFGASIFGMNGEDRENYRVVKNNGEEHMFIKDEYYVDDISGKIERMLLARRNVDMEAKTS